MILHAYSVICIPSRVVLCISASTEPVPCVSLCVPCADFEHDLVPTMLRHGPSKSKQQHVIPRSIFSIRGARGHNKPGRATSRWLNSDTGAWSRMDGEDPGSPAGPSEATLGAMCQPVFSQGSELGVKRGRCRRLPNA